MSEELKGVLTEIAISLKRGVELQEEAAVRSIEQARKSDERLAELRNRPALDDMQNDARKTIETQRTENAKIMEQMRASTETRQDADRQFKRDLLTEMRRHNETTERLLSELALAISKMSG